MNPTQVSDFRNFNVDNIVFSKPEVGSIAGSIPKISFKRIRLAVRNPDHSVGEFVMLSPANLLSFGLQENIEMGTGVVNGYQFPVCLYNKNGASEEEKKFVTMFNQIVEHCKKHLVGHRDDIEKYDLEMNDLKKFNPLYWKMEKGKIVEDRGPMMYLKVVNNRATDKISTFFIDDETNTFMDPKDLLNKRCLTTVAIKFESIFIGNKISIQIKLKEAIVRLMDTTTVQSLLRPKARFVDAQSAQSGPQSSVVMEAVKAAMDQKPSTKFQDEEGDEEEEGSLVGDEEDDKEEEEEEGEGEEEEEGEGEDEENEVASPPTASKSSIPVVAVQPVVTETPTASSKVVEGAPVEKKAAVRGRKPKA